MKSAIFIDGDYVRKVWLRKKGILDFEQLSTLLTDGTERMRTYYYNCKPIWNPNTGEGNEELFNKMEKFFTALQKLPRFQLVFGRLREMDGKFTQKGVDMRLGIDLVQQSLTGQIGKVVLLANDSDYVYAIEKAKDAGVIVVLAYFPESSVNEDLLTVVDEKIKLSNEFLKNCTWN